MEGVLQQILSAVEAQNSRIDQLASKMEELQSRQDAVFVAVDEIRRATNVPEPPDILEEETQRELTPQGPSITVKCVSPLLYSRPLTEWAIGGHHRRPYQRQSRVTL